MDENTTPQLPITYYASKRKMFSGFIGYFIVVVIAFIMIIKPMPTSWLSTNMALFIGCLGVLFFGFCMLTSLHALIGKMVIFTIDENGILYYLFWHKKIITWSEITEIKIVQQSIPSLFGKKRLREFVGIFLKDPNSYLASLKPIFRMIALSTNKAVGTPVILNCSLTDLDAITLLNWLKQYQTQFIKHK